MSPASPLPRGMKKKPANKIISDMVILGIKL